MRVIFLIPLLYIVDAVSSVFATSMLLYMTYIYNNIYNVITYVYNILDMQVHIWVYQEQKGWKGPV